jgi:hypothetical protein
LALTTTLLDASETDERRYASKMNLENRKTRGSSHQYMGWMSERISLRLPVAGEVFFLDIPFYRTCYMDDVQTKRRFGERQRFVSSERASFAGRRICLQSQTEELAPNI